MKSIRLIFTILMLFNIKIFTQGIYLGHELECGCIYKEQLRFYLKQAIGKERYIEILKIGKEKNDLVLLFQIGIDTTGKIIDYSLYDKYSFLTEKEKGKIKKIVLRHYYDFCIYDWEFKDKSLVEIHNLYNGIIKFMIPFP